METSFDPKHKHCLHRSCAAPLRCLPLRGLPGPAQHHRWEGANAGEKALPYPTPSPPSPLGLGVRGSVCVSVGRACDHEDISQELCRLVLAQPHTQYNSPITPTAAALDDGLCAPGTHGVKWATQGSDVTTSLKCPGVFWKGSAHLSSGTLNAARGQNPCLGSSRLTTYYLSVDGTRTVCVAS
jgi:hypothetical protein